MLLGALLLFFSCACFYSMADKTEVKTFIHLKRFAHSLLIIRGLGLLFLLVGLLLMILAAGVVKGLILTITIWTGIGGLLILFIPFLYRKPEA